MSETITHVSHYDLPTALILVLFASILFWVLGVFSPQIENHNKEEN